jgi:alpha/beta superfamily hydrolase
MAAESLVLTTTDGIRLEAQIDVPDGVHGAVVLCHPHPLYGGSMHDGVPDALFRALPARGIAAIRFNFRGVGASTGTHDKGDAERHDVAAAIDALVAALDARGLDVPVVVPARSCSPRWTATGPRTASTCPSPGP